MTQSICIITGSTLGGAEYVADHLESCLTAKGFEVKLFNNAELSDIQSQQTLIVVTSTHGAGELPDNIRPLFEALENQPLDLSQMKFGVFRQFRLRHLLPRGGYCRKCLKSQRCSAGVRF